MTTESGTAGVCKFIFRPSCSVSGAQLTFVDLADKTLVYTGSVDEITHLPPADYNVRWMATIDSQPASAEYGPVSISVACDGGIPPSYGPCQGVTCQNGGACNDADGSCSCVHPYEGDHCEISTDPCFGIDCNGNKGHCVATTGAAECECFEELG